MSQSNKCINCERDDNVAPLVSITFAQNPTWICTQCLPTLIHNPGQLQDKFANIKVDNPPAPLKD